MLELPPLDGVLLANALHYVPYSEQARVVRQVASLLEPGAPLVIVEYDRRHANRWVPYPVSPTALATLARNAELGEPAVLGTRPSAFGGTLYSTVVRG